MTALPSDGSEDLQLVLAASKCLDLLLVLQTQEFQMSGFMSWSRNAVDGLHLDISGYSSQTQLMPSTVQTIGSQKQ
jgi:hypothetical protein